MRVCIYIYIYISELFQKVMLPNCKIRRILRPLSKQFEGYLNHIITNTKNTIQHDFFQGLLHVNRPNKKHN